MRFHDNGVLSSYTSGAGSTCLAEMFPIRSMSRSIIVFPKLADSLLNSEVATGVSTTKLPKSVCALIFVGYIFLGFSIFTYFMIRVTQHPQLFKFVDVGHGGV